MNLDTCVNVRRAYLNYNGQDMKDKVYRKDKVRNSYAFGEYILQSGFVIEEQRNPHMME